jgi:FlaA1/EpsC-like NDP-sugar epimerase
VFVFFRHSTTVDSQTVVNALEWDAFQMRFFSTVVGFSRRVKQATALATDVLFILFTVWLAFSLRYDTMHCPVGVEWIAYIAAILLSLPIFIRSGLYLSIFRYSGLRALGIITSACARYALFYFMVVLVLRPAGIPLSVGILQPLLLLLAIGSSRAMVRFWLHPGNAPDSVSTFREKLLIYGAGSAGVQIASALQYNAIYSIRGFIDDDPALHGKSVNGITIYNPDEVPSLVESQCISAILIALPSATRFRRQEIYRSLKTPGLHIRTLPGIEALADGKVSVSDIKEVDIEDLLGRDPVPPDPELFARCIKGKTVLVTGAGGSIGSELCRQILVRNPERLILLEHSEYNLYALHQDLGERILEHALKVSLVPLLADVTDQRHMIEVFERYRPHTVYHAAAYKHVPMVESNPAEGLRNNVFGTRSVAQAAERSGVGHFVLISTDKAVRPTNVMGASKRIAEIILQSMAAGQREGSTCFSMVRFGNVLGSSGSVVPLFRRQIASGGPVTVTHKEVTRYFMTIPEAAQLVIQAGAMAGGGDVFLLDMGEPVRIVDLARRMTELSGLTVKDQEHPDGDIEIVVTGLRPGEKLYEELLIGESPMSTAHPRIFKANEDFVPKDELEVLLDELGVAIRENDAWLIRMMLCKMLPEYAPQNDGSDFPDGAAGSVGLEPVAGLQPMTPEKGRNGHAGQPQIEALPFLPFACMEQASIDGVYAQKKQQAHPSEKTKMTEP